MELLGIDIGGTKCAVVRGNEDGQVLEKVKFSTTNVNDTLDNILSAAKKLAHDSAAVGISCGGPLNSETGVILSPPNLPGWDNIEIVKIINKQLGLPAYLCNDANACALAEFKFGAGIGSRNMVFLTFGTGMGAGLILDGKLYNGTNGNAGEIGHIRMENFGPTGYGKQGSFEGFASGGGIAMYGKIKACEALQRGEKPMYCKELSELSEINAKTIADAAEKGDKTAIEVYETAGRMLGRGIAVLADILNPDRIVIGSIFERSAELLEKSMYEEMKKEALSASLEVLEVVKAKLGNSIGDAAALALALDCYERSKDKNA